MPASFEILSLRVSSDSYRDESSGLCRDLYQGMPFGLHNQAAKRQTIAQRLKPLALPTVRHG